jgi:hypothetical protein
VENEVLDKYTLLLPAFWHGMEPAEKKRAVAIVEKNSGFTPQCVQELQLSLHIPYKDMQHLRVCIQCAKEDPGQLNMGLPALRSSNPSETSPEVEDGHAAAKGMGHGLDTFLFNGKEGP